MGNKITALSALTEDTLDGSDVMPVVDVSAGTSGTKKTLMSSLGKWIIGKFTGLTLCGKSQSVKSAIDELNNNIASQMLTAATDSVDNLWKNGLYFLGNAPGGKPLDTTGNNTGGICIVTGTNTNGVTAQNICKIFVYTNQTLHPGIYIRSYSGTNDMGWKHIMSLIPKKTYASLPNMRTTGVITSGARTIHCPVLGLGQVDTDFIADYSVTGSVSVSENGVWIIGGASSYISLDDNSVFEAVTLYRVGTSVYMSMRTLAIPSGATNNGTVNILFQSLVINPA